MANYPIEQKEVMAIFERYLGTFWVAPSRNSPGVNAFMRGDLRFSNMFGIRPDGVSALTTTSH